MTVRPYRREVPITWWMGSRAYTLFVLRELTSVPIALALLSLLILLYRLSQGPDAYQAHLQVLASPGMIAFHVVALVAAVYHSVTWFLLAPMSLTLRVGGRRVPDRVIVLGNYAAWVIVSAVITLLVLRGP